jgi:hypothetical protein
MTVHEAITAADAILPGQAAPEGEIDPRWQAIIVVGEFIEQEPQAVWSFIVRWGSSPDDDLRTAIATCLLEHLLEHHFDAFIARVEDLALADPLFGRMVAMCWKFGRCEEEKRSERFDRLLHSLKSID